MDRQNQTTGEHENTSQSCLMWPLPVNATTSGVAAT